MRIGEYRITIQNMEGELLAEVERTAATGHPLVGEEIVLDGQVYRVERVRHEEDAEPRTRRRYTWPRLFVRRRDGLVNGRRHDAVRAPPRVLPFPTVRKPRDGVKSVILPPSLVAVLVACGYDLQAQYFARRARGATRILRAGQGWFVEAGESPAEAREQAREARRGRRRLEDWLPALAAPHVVALIRAERERAARAREIERREQEERARELHRRVELRLFSDGAAWTWRAAWKARAIQAVP